MPATNAKAQTTSWAGEQLLSGSADAWEPFIAADPNSPRVYAAWFTPYGPSLCNSCPTSVIYLQTSPDNGVTWSAPRWAFTTTSPHGQYDPTLKVVANTGAVYAMWMDWNQIIFSKSTDYGQTWTPQKQISGTQWADHPWFGTSANGQHIYAFWSKGDVYGVASHDYGVTWTTPKKVNADKNRQYYAEGVEVLADGTVILAAISYPCSKGTSQCNGIININTFRSTNEGGTYTQTIVESLSTGPQWMTQGLETIASDAAGNLMLMYNGAASIGANNQMYVRLSTNKGVSWGNRKLISTGPGADACYPAIAGAAKGNFRAIYCDNRSGAYNIWYRETKDSGATWSADVRLSDKPDGALYKNANGFGTPYGDYLNVAVLSSGRTIAIFGEAGPKQVSPGGIWYNRSIGSSPSPNLKATPNETIEEKSGIHIKAIPNPFTDKMRIVVNLPDATTGVLELFDGSGEKIKTVHEGIFPKGIKTFNVVIPSGGSKTYFYVFRTGKQKVTGQLIRQAEQ